MAIPFTAAEVYRTGDPRTANQGKVLMFPRPTTSAAIFSAVNDFAIKLSTAHPERIALSGWSLCGHLAPRAGSIILPLVADPGEWSDGLDRLPCRQGCRLQERHQLHRDFRHSE
jgi:hypothetical protein